MLPFETFACGRSGPRWCTRRRLTLNRRQQGLHESVRAPVLKPKAYAPSTQFIAQCASAFLKSNRTDLTRHTADFGVARARPLGKV